MKTWNTLFMIGYSLYFSSILSPTAAFTVPQTRRRTTWPPTKSIDRAWISSRSYRSQLNLSTPRHNLHFNGLERLQNLLPKFRKQVGKILQWCYDIPNSTGLTSFLNRRKRRNSATRRNEKKRRSSRLHNDALTTAEDNDLQTSDTQQTTTLTLDPPPPSLTSGSAEDSIVDEAAGPQAVVPQGSRWAVSASTTDLSGEWKPVVTPAFKKEYDQYLISCGEGIFFRKALLAAIGLGKEVYEQREEGKELTITGVTPVTQWKRMLVASGAENDTTEYEPVYTTFRDPDGDTVQVEAWWENDGTVHKSILRGKPRVLGGEFESRRYLSPQDENVLICESTFHPPPGDHPKFREDRVEWRFERQ